MAFTASVQELEFSEKGGCADVQGKCKVRRYRSAAVQRMMRPEEERPREAQSPKNKTVSSGKSYTVKQGDTLSQIAKCLLGDASRWDEIYQLNQDVIKNPNLIAPGMQLKLPNDAIDGTVTPIQGKAKKTNNSKNTAKTGGSSGSTSSAASAPVTSKGAKGGNPMHGGPPASTYGGTVRMKQKYLPSGRAFGGSINSVGATGGRGKK